MSSYWFWYIFAAKSSWCDSGSATIAKHSSAHIPHYRLKLPLLFASRAVNSIWSQKNHISRFLQKLFFIYLNLHYQYISVDVDGSIYFAILSFGCVVLATFLDRWMNCILFNLITWVFFGMYFYRRGADEKWVPFKRLYICNRKYAFSAYKKYDCFIDNLIPLI